MVRYSFMRPCDLLISLCEGALSTVRPHDGILRVLGQALESMGVFLLEDGSFFQEGRKILYLVSHRAGLRCQVDVLLPS